MTLPIVPAPDLPSQASSAWLPIRYQIGYGSGPGQARLNPPPVAVARAGAVVKLTNRGPWPVGLTIDQNDRYNLLHTLYPGCSIGWGPATADLYALIALYPLAPGNVVPGVSYFEPVLAIVEALSLP